MTAEDASAKLAELAVQSQSDDYKEIWEQWKTIDTKAQGVIVVSGIALTGLFAVLRDRPSTDALARCIVAASVIAAFGAAVAALIALRVRDVESAPTGKSISDLVAQIQAKGVETQALPERYPRLLNDIRKLWEKPLADNRIALVAKASWLWRAQMMIVGSMLCLGAATLFHIYH